MPAKHDASFGQARRWARALRHWRLLPNTFTIMVNGDGGGGMTASGGCMLRRGFLLILATAFQHAQLEPLRFGACQTHPRRDGFVSQMMMMGSAYTAVGTGLHHHEMKTGTEKARMVMAFSKEAAAKPVFQPNCRHGSRKPPTYIVQERYHCTMPRSLQAPGVAAHPTESLGLAGGAASKKRFA